MDKKPLRTIVYIDGFNLYYGQLKGTPYKWLDPVALFQRVLGPQNQITQIIRHRIRMENAAPPPATVAVWKREKHPGNLPSTPTS